MGHGKLEQLGSVALILLRREDIQVFDQVFLDGDNPHRGILYEHIERHAAPQFLLKKGLLPQGGVGLYKCLTAKAAVGGLPGFRVDGGRGHKGFFSDGQDHGADLRASNQADAG